MDYRAFLTGLFLFGMVTFVITGCSEEEKYEDLVELDLIAEGVPIVIKAPEGAVVEVKDMVVQRDITVRKGEEFSLQIFESDAFERNVPAIKQRLMSEVQKNPYFRDIVEVDDNGFIYETAVDSNYINYGFRHVRLQGDKEYIFQTAMRGKFSLEDVQRMKMAVETQ